LKAKLSLDLFTLEINIAAEYPDMVEENSELYAKVDDLAA
jgi:hypothetical protein